MRRHDGARQRAGANLAIEPDGPYSANDCHQEYMKALVKYASGIGNVDLRSISFWGKRSGMSKTIENPARYKSPLYEMTQTTPTCLWNDSATLTELTTTFSEKSLTIMVCPPDFFPFAGIIMNPEAVAFERL